MRTKNSVSSSIYNTNAITSGIAKIDITWASTKDTFDNTDIIKFEFSNSADFADANVEYLSTTAGVKEYTITPESNTYKYVRITHNGSNTYYINEFKVVLASSTPEVPCEHIFDKTVQSADTLATDGDCQTKATYYYSCVCGELDKTRTFEGEYGDHKLSSTYESDENIHWLKCTVDGCTHTTTPEAHKGGSATTTQ